MLFNNQPAVIDDDFLVSIPEKGSLSFDFIVLHDYAFAKMDSTLSTRRLHKILRNLRMLEELKEADLRDLKAFHEKVEKLDEEGKVRISCMGFGLLIRSLIQKLVALLLTAYQEMVELI